MRAPAYDPALGRFLEVDPVEGGSANDYDYCGGDPINCFDLGGTDATSDFLQAYSKMSDRDKKVLTVLSAAKSQMGANYSHARPPQPIGTGPGGRGGIDCSGLVMYSYGQIGVSMNSSAATQIRQGTAVSMSSLQPGDLIFYDTANNSRNTVNHVAIYMGNGQAAMAHDFGKPATITNINTSYWNERVMGARRII